MPTKLYDGMPQDDEAPELVRPHRPGHPNLEMVERVDLLLNQLSIASAGAERATTEINMTAPRSDEQNRAVARYDQAAVKHRDSRIEIMEIVLKLAGIKMEEYYVTGVIY